MQEAAAARALRPDDAEVPDIERRAKQGQAETLNTSARQALDRKDFDSAVKAFTEALKMAPEDKAATGLLGQAVTQQVDDLVSPARMEYKKARRAIADVQTFLDDAVAKTALERIRTLEEDPKTANVTGFWKAPGGVVRLEGTDKIITMSMGPDRGRLQNVGSWERNAGRMNGTFGERSREPGGGTLKATIKKATARIVDPRRIEVTVPRMKPPTVTWTKEEEKEEEPASRPEPKGRGGPYGPSPYYGRGYRAPGVPGPGASPPGSR
jgi:hypothetical protein